jgi:group II intron reverse transcriptase/maturase
LEDKIAQRATVKVLEAIYENDFKGFSYGFRPGRSAHDALDALAVGIRHKKVNWVLDADIRGFFDAIDHEWLVKFIAHRIADRRVIRHIVKWLKAGVMEEGKRLATTEGTPQGGSVSPLLANIYLHYALDLWMDQWRRRRARGDVIFVRYADDFVLGFQYRSDAEKFVGELRERLRRFNLELHDDKTRLIEFGRFAAQNRKQRGQGKPATFNFLGFTHICGKTQKGRFVVWRLTMRKRLVAKLKQIKAELRRRMHQSIPVVGQWLRRILQGHYNYYGVPLNYRAMSTFRYEVSRLWFRTLRRRSQKTRLNWDRMSRLGRRWLPFPKIRHPYPEQRLRVFTQGRSPVR